MVNKIKQSRFTEQPENVAISLQLRLCYYELIYPVDGTLYDSTDDITDKINTATTATKPLAW